MNEIRRVGPDLDDRLRAVSDALYRRERSFRSDIGLERDDILQIARENALETLRRKPDATTSYVVTAAHWKILDTFRADRRAASRISGKPVDPELDNDDTPTADDDTDSTLERLAGSSGYISAVWLAVWLLPDPQREVILLRAEGLTSKEIADRLGVPRGTVKSRTARARERLLTPRKDL